MPLIYITGVSGAGKTTVSHELVARGFESYDIEEDNLVEWRNTETDEKASFPHQFKDEKLHDWYRTHMPYLDLGRVGLLKAMVEETDKLVYLCGSAYGEDDAYHYFDVVIALAANLDTLKKRIVDRRHSIYGKDADEMRYIERWYTKAEADYAKRGTLRVDTTQPLPNVIATILEMTNGKH